MSNATEEAFIHVQVEEALKRKVERAAEAEERTLSSAVRYVMSRWADGVLETAGETGDETPTTNGSR